MGTVPGRRPDTGGEERREGQRATPARSELGLSGLPRPLPRWPLLCWFAAKRGLRGQEPQTAVSGALCALAEAAPHTQAALGTGEPGLARTGSPGSPLPLTAPWSGSWRAL